MTDKNSLSINIDSDLYEKFNIALKLTKESLEQGIESSIRWYITKAFSEVAHTYKISSPEKNIPKDYHAKAIQRIPLWAVKPKQINHKIIRAFFIAVDETGKATLSHMEKLCRDKNNPDLYVSTFKNNYSQMKIDSPKSHGKVFEDDGEKVWIWEDIKDTLLKYKENFTNCDTKQQKA